MKVVVISLYLVQESSDYLYSIFSLSVQLWVIWTAGVMLELVGEEKIANV